MTFSSTFSQKSNTRVFLFNIRGGSRAAATPKMECFVNGWKPLTIITKRSILDVAAVRDPPLNIIDFIFLIPVFEKDILQFCSYHNGFR